MGRSSRCSLDGGELTTIKVFVPLCVGHSLRGDFIIDTSGVAGNTVLARKSIHTNACFRRL